MEVAPRYTLPTLFTLSTLFNIIHTIQTAQHCLNNSTYAYILLGKVRSLLELADGS